MQANARRAPRGVSGRRFLVLHLPQVATDRIRRKEPELGDLPVATWDTHGNRRVVTGVDAPGTTLHVGQALADARAMYPALVLRPADMDADKAFLERLALWALRFTPIAAVDPPDGLVLDVTGCTDLMGGEGLPTNDQADFGRSVGSFSGSNMVRLVSMTHAIPSRRSTTVLRARP